MVVEADARWPEEFRQAARRLRDALGSIAQRIDHVGSTSVPRLDAKPVIDIQISVVSLEPEHVFRRPLERLGFLCSVNNADRTQRFFREPPGDRRLHIHVRQIGSFDEQLNLLLRDYLRSHPSAVKEYAGAKRRLARAFRHDRAGYVKAKEPVVWSLLLRAHDWGQANGWTAGPSDA